MWKVTHSQSFPATCLQSKRTDMLNEMGIERKEQYSGRERVPDNPKKNK
jgi:hypothetical protein